MLKRVAQLGKRADESRYAKSWLRIVFAAALLTLGFSHGPVVTLAGTTSPRQLRFSPDGRYALAQDDAVIFVLTGTGRKRHSGAVCARFGGRRVHQFGSSKQSGNNR
jgi:hypothetical protein